MSDKLKNVIRTTVAPQRTVSTLSTPSGIEPMFPTEPYVLRIRASDDDLRGEDLNKMIEAFKIRFAEMSKAIDPSIKIRPVDVVYEGTTDTFMYAYRKPVPVVRWGRFDRPVMLGKIDDAVSSPQQTAAPVKVCECGVDSIGGGIHSSYCPKA